MYKNRMGPLRPPAVVEVFVKALPPATVSSNKHSVFEELVRIRNFVSYV